MQDRCVLYKSGNYTNCGEDQNTDKIIERPRAFIKYWTIIGKKSFKLNAQDYKPKNLWLWKTVLSPSDCPVRTVQSQCRTVYKHCKPPWTVSIECESMLFVTNYIPELWGLSNSFSNTFVGFHSCEAVFVKSYEKERNITLRGIDNGRVDMKLWTYFM